MRSIRPLPKDAVGDRPSFYDDGSGCQVADGDPQPRVCPFGDPAGAKTLMLVGDSKAARWQPAFDGLAKREHWKLLSTTKRSCAFTDAAVTANHQVRTDCREWGRRTLQDILRLKPDVVVTSQVHDTALPAGKTDDRDRTTKAMLDGLESYWKQLQSAGVRVVVLLDNPMPTTHPVYQCVQDNPTNLTKCAYRFATALAHSTAELQRRAAKTTSHVGIIDMAPTYCPAEHMCPAVIGNVLVYRAGSHLTKTFVVSAEQQLAAELARATDGEFGSVKIGNG